MTSRGLVLLAANVLLVSGTAWALQGHDENPDFPAIPYDHKAIQYMERPTNDPVARLQKQLDKGEKLDFHPRWGYLPDLLKRLGINTDSQILVFSKTSAQLAQISPATPRAIYFNDDAAIGYVQDGRVLELTALDPMQGMIFYTLDVDKTSKPTFSRQEITCLKCHITPATLNIPGIMISSVFRTENESPFGRAGSFATDHRIPLSDRWGGWYVTGTHGSLRHRGNVPVERSDFPGEARINESQNLTSLDERIPTAAYLAPTSDIVALMTMEHQTRMLNLITRVGWETRVATAEGTLGDFKERLDGDIEELLAYMLFVEEAPIPSPIQGVSTFTKTFSQRGPRDKQGRSLRDFDMRKRMFRYPLSYMIYSPAFDALPDIARNGIYRKLFDILTGKEKSEPFAHIATDDRRAILEILRETKKNLPAYWKGSPAGE